MNSTISFLGKNVDELIDGADAIFEKVDVFDVLDVWDRVDLSDEEVRVFVVSVDGGSFSGGCVGSGCGCGCGCGGGGAGAGGGSVSSIARTQSRS